MHKLILSIIAVAFFQIAFITYVTSDKTADNAAIYKAPATNLPATPAANDESIEVVSIDEDPFFRREIVNDGNSPTVRFEKTEYPVRRKNVRANRKTPTRSAPFVPEQVIITYAVHKPYKFTERESYRNVSVYNEPVVNKSESTELPVIKTEKSDSNPILNVIKKPYSWIKALGSKLK